MIINMYNGSQPATTNGRFHLRKKKKEKGSK